MKRKIFILPLAFLFSVLYSNAQLYDSTGYYNQMNYIFAPLDKSQITSGLLKDYSIEFNNWDNFIGAQTLVKVYTRNKFQALLPISA